MNIRYRFKTEEIKEKSENILDLVQKSNINSSLMQELKQDLDELVELARQEGAERFREKVNSHKYGIREMY